MNNKETKDILAQPWKDRGDLKTPREPLDLSFWRVVLFVNWASGWTWATVTSGGDLKHTLFGITKTQRIGSDGNVLNAYAFVFLKLAITIGVA